MYIYTYIPWQNENNKRNVQIKPAQPTVQTEPKQFLMETPSFMLLVKEWTLGSKGYYAGHHCSWCYQPEVKSSHKKGIKQGGFKQIPILLGMINF